MKKISAERRGREKGGERKRGRRREEKERREESKEEGKRKRMRAEDEETIDYRRRWLVASDCRLYISLHVTVFT